MNTCAVQFHLNLYNSMCFRSKSCTSLMRHMIIIVLNVGANLVKNGKLWVEKQTNKELQNIIFLTHHKLCNCKGFVTQQFGAKSHIII